MANQMVFKQTIILFDCGVGRQKKKRDDWKNKAKIIHKQIRKIAFFFHFYCLNTNVIGSLLQNRLSNDLLNKNF